MRIALLSPYHGGSHRAWAEGWAANSRHSIEILGLPDQFWKWRMHGGAVRLAEEYRQKFPRTPYPRATAMAAATATATARAMAGASDSHSQPGTPDLIVTTDMLDLTSFLALARAETAEIPVLYYAHENQWTYPLPVDPTTGPMRRQKGERDRHYAWINFVSMLAADRIAFNSGFHRHEFLRSLPAFLNHYPDETDPAWIEQIEERSSVLPLGIDLARLAGQRVAASPGPPLILWNHRWEYDKDPDAFFAAIDAVAARGVPFRLAVCGTNSRTHTPEFDLARSRHRDRVVHWGGVEGAAYGELLLQADVVVSTARHEFFGISVCEAIFCGAFPLLPNRLSYPELIPPDLHGSVLYGSPEHLVERLIEVLSEPAARESAGARLRAEVSRHDWARRASEYDCQLDMWFTR